MPVTAPIPAPIAASSPIPSVSSFSVFPIIAPPVTFVSRISIPIISIIFHSITILSCSIPFPPPSVFLCSRLSRSLWCSPPALRSFSFSSSSIFFEYASAFCCCWATTLENEINEMSHNYLNSITYSDQMTLGIPLEIFLHQHCPYDCNTEMHREIETYSGIVK
jgi:hypothetical protein